MWSLILFPILFSYLTVALFDTYVTGKVMLKIKNWRMIVIILLLSLPYYFIVNAANQRPGHWSIDFGEQYQSLPNYLILFATLLSIYLLYKTLVSQNRTLDAQRKESQLSAFENRFFKFLDYHRENVSQLKYRKPNDPGEKYYEGNQVFTVIHYEIRDLLKRLSQQYSLSTPADKRDAINFCYQCVFFGAGEGGLKILQSRFNKHKFWSAIHFENRLAAYSVKYDTPNRKREKYYSGHVRRLGHYFRNLYQTIQYIEDQKFLSEDEKYEYVTHLRAQMSVYEQSVFFYNSVSDLGKSWELSEYERKYPTFNDRKKVFKDLWVTKYDMVRNTLNDNGLVTLNISIKDFYPLLNIEGQIEFTQCGKLPFAGNDNYICRLCFNTRYVGNSIERVQEELKYYFKQHPDFINELKCDERKCVTRGVAI